MGPRGLPHGVHQGALKEAPDSIWKNESGTLAVILCLETKGICNFSRSKRTTPTLCPVSANCILWANCESVVLESNDPHTKLPRQCSDALRAKFAHHCRGAYSVHTRESTSDNCGAQTRVWRLDTEYRVGRGAPELATGQPHLATRLRSPAWHKPTTPFQFAYGLPQPQLVQQMRHRHLETREQAHLP
jgi:hypothetical protein